VSSDEGVLLIDLDGTLIDREAGFRRWADGFLRRLGRHAPDDLAWIVDLDGTGLTPRERLFGGIRRRYGLAETVAELIDAYYKEFPPLIPPPSRDDLAALAAARTAGWKLCIVTNGGPQAQVPKISPELAAAVDGSVISEIVGVEKPDPRILEAAAAEVGRCLTPTSWMIGDHHENRCSRSRSGRDPQCLDQREPGMGQFLALPSRSRGRDLRRRGDRDPRLIPRGTRAPEPVVADLFVEKVSVHGATDASGEDFMLATSSSTPSGYSGKVASISSKVRTTAVSFAAGPTDSGTT
jgi:FMN phosphatase YigB (HAD superfamily)